MSLSFRSFAAWAAGALSATLLWEIYARHAAPHWLSAVGSEAAAPGGGAVLTLPFQAGAAHLTAALVVYPLIYLTLLRPLARRAAPWVPETAIGLGFGALISTGALYGAALAAGGPAWLGWTPEAGLAHAAAAIVAGHLLYGLGLSFGVRRALAA